MWAMIAFLLPYNFLLSMIFNPIAVILSAAEISAMGLIFNLYKLFSIYGGKL